MYREKEDFFILQILFYQHVEIQHREYLVLTTGFYKRLHHRFIDLPSPDHRVTDRLIIRSVSLL